MDMRKAKSWLILLVPLLAVSCTTPPGTNERTVYQEPDQRACTEKPPSYTSAFEGRLKADLPLAGKSAAEAESLIRSYLSQQPVGTKMGEDLQGYLFYICQIANNGHWTAEETNRAISLFMDKWNNGMPEATLPNPKCMKQLEKGYALKDDIDNEYWQTKRAGTFHDKMDEFRAKWNRDAGRWAAETEAVLVQISGPIDRGRFRNAPISPTVLDNTNMYWNGVRNFLQGRLSALDSICAPLR